MAEHRRATATWADLVLPDAEMRQLRSIADDAGAQGRGRRHGSAGVALFLGPRGSGKASAAEAIASQLRLDVYRIDLGAIVERYLGETEKELDRLLSEAAVQEVVLLIEEADALFGDRTDVHDAHDRYANLDTNDLLDRIEAVPGLVILASNRKHDLDEAFLRRLRYVVTFPPFHRAAPPG